MMSPFDTPTTSGVSTGGALCSPKNIQAEGPKREKNGKRKKVEREEKERSKKGEKEASCKYSFPFLFLLTWVDSVAGARLRQPV
jgi:hypothetical protein